MKAKWFKKKGWIYIPSSAIGTILYFITVLFCVTVFTAVDRHSHSVSDTLYGIFPFFISAFTVLFWVAQNTSSVKQNESN